MNWGLFWWLLAGGTWVTLVVLLCSLTFGIYEEYEWPHNIVLSFATAVLTVVIIASGIGIAVQQRRDYDQRKRAVTCAHIRSDIETQSKQQITRYEGWDKAANDWDTSHPSYPGSNPFRYVPGSWAELAAAGCDQS